MCFFSGLASVLWEVAQNFTDYSIFSFFFVWISLSRFLVQSLVESCVFISLLFSSLVILVGYYVLVIACVWWQSEMNRFIVTFPWSPERSEAWEWFENVKVIWGSIFQEVALDDMLLQTNRMEKKNIDNFIFVTRLISGIGDLIN